MFVALARTTAVGYKARARIRLAIRPGGAQGNRMSDKVTKQGAAPDDPVADAILALLAAGDPGQSVSLMDAARAYADIRRRPKDGPDLWRRYMNAVRQQARHLARQGRIEILRKGKPLDPNDVKGVVRLRLPQGGQPE